MYVEVHPLAETADPVTLNTLPQGAMFLHEGNRWLKGPLNDQSQYMCVLLGGNNPAGTEEFGGAEQVVPLPDYYITTGK